MCARITMVETGGITLLKPQSHLDMLSLERALEYTVLCLELNMKCVHTAGSTR